jgi:capsular polysaccharide transport system permease protein
MATIRKRSNWQIWGDVIFALFVREIKTGFNDKLGISWSVINPVLFIFLLSFIRGRMGGAQIHGIPTFMFMVYGMVLIQLFLNTLMSVSTAIKKNKPLYAFRQVQPVSAIIAASIFELIVKIFVIFVIAVIAFFMGMSFQMDNAIAVMVNVLMLWVIAISLGIIFAIAACYVEEVNKILGLLVRPLFFISGIFFSLNDIPSKYWSYVDWNPILHAIELSRGAAYSSYPTAGVSEFYLNASALFIFTLASFIYFSFWKQAISRN